MVAITALVVAALASAAQAGKIQVSGVQSPQPDGSYLMNGSLIGVWSTTSVLREGIRAGGGRPGRRD
jgi:hypothetical protein